MGGFGGCRTQVRLGSVGTARPLSTQGFIPEQSQRFLALSAALSPRPFSPTGGKARGGSYLQNLWTPGSPPSPELLYQRCSPRRLQKQRFLLLLAGPGRGHGIITGRDRGSPALGADNRQGWVPPAPQGNRGDQLASLSARLCLITQGNKMHLWRALPR